MEGYYIIELKSGLYYQGVGTYNFSTQPKQEITSVAYLESEAMGFKTKEEAQREISVLLKNESNKKRFPNMKPYFIAYDNEEPTFVKSEVDESDDIDLSDA